MELLRIALVSLVCGALAIFLGRVLLIGLRTGKIAHTDTDSFFDIKKNPLGYWLLVGLFFGLFSTSVYVLARLSYDVIKNRIESLSSLLFQPAP